MKKAHILFISFAAIAQLYIEASLLQINQEVLLTDTTGVINVRQISSVEVGKQVKIYRTDGVAYTGKVTEIEESSTSYKVYGTITNVADAYFGFSLIKGGTFVGAVVEQASNSTYVAEFSLEHKGFILLRSFKHDRPGA
jgi:hypothetical protein